MDSQSVDQVLATWTLCSIPQPERALAEIYRVLRPGGRFHFAEHGRSPDPKVARWQDRLSPIQRRLAGGCHLNRPIQALIEASGLELAKIANYHLQGPRHSAICTKASPPNPDLSTPSFRPGTPERTGA